MQVAKRSRWKLVYCIARFIWWEYFRGHASCWTHRATSLHAPDGIKLEAHVVVNGRAALVKPVWARALNIYPHTAI